MAGAASNVPPSLVEQYALKEKEETPIVTTKPADVKEPENIVQTASEEVDATPSEVPPTDVSLPVSEESTDATADEPSVEKAEEVTAATGAIEENTELSEEGKVAEAETTEEASEIKLETAPADFRFPTTNQTRHCFTRYIEYHRCIASKGEDAPECDKFAKYYRSLCPGEWVDKWNEQRENGTFPGPL
ncbi:hypothetical protein SAY87_021945 [Trapa incisa]|uniref:Cytochrome c oxidase subunit n=1 Tax=Trapa incisa TaxID=236973 RepID=A0AAN7JUB2_9MYRT|nr:hypothetical protein SAY87_021945 [Trapa incisa]